MDDPRMGHLPNAQKIEVLELTAQRQAKRLEQVYGGIAQLEKNMDELEIVIDVLNEAVWELLFDAEDVDAWSDVYKMKGHGDYKNRAVDMAYRLKGALGPRPSHIKDFIHAPPDSEPQ